MREDIDTQAIKRFVEDDVTAKRNECTVEEFQPYVVLFSRQVQTGNTGLSKEQLSELVQSFHGRFSSYHPIVIKDHNGNVVKTIGPSRKRMGLLNDTVDPDGTMTSSYQNIMISQSQPAHKKDAISRTMVDAVTAVASKAKVVESKVSGVDSGGNEMTDWDWN